MLSITSISRARLDLNDTYCRSRRLESKIFLWHMSQSNKTRLRISTGGGGSPEEHLLRPEYEPLEPWLGKSKFWSSKFQLSCPRKGVLTPDECESAVAGPGLAFPPDQNPLIGGE